MSKTNPQDLPNALTARLQEMRDDFSVRFTLADDPRFWIRIELPLGDPLVISDLTLGQQAPETVGAFLAHALRQIGASRARRLVVNDVGPAEQSPQIDQIIDYYIALERRFIRDRARATAGRKTNLIVSFHEIN